MIVVDSSAWVDFLRGAGTSQDTGVQTLVLRNEAVVPDVVRLEILAGAGTEARAPPMRSRRRSPRCVRT